MNRVALTICFSHSQHDLIIYFPEIKLPRPLPSSRSNPGPGRCKVATIFTTLSVPHSRKSGSNPDMMVQCNKTTFQAEDRIQSKETTFCPYSALAFCLSLLCLTNAMLRMPVCDRVLSQQLSEGLMSVRRKKRTGKKRWKREWKKTKLRCNKGSVTNSSQYYSPSHPTLLARALRHIPFFLQQKGVWSWTPQSKAGLFYFCVALHCSFNRPVREHLNHRHHTH